MKSNNTPRVCPPPVFLIGFMCSGKTTLGRAVARANGTEFIDLDEYIEASEGMTVRQIFQRKGEDAFRKAERASLVEIIEACGSKNAPVIVACGGGTPCFYDNMEVMNAAGVTVWLQPRDEQVLLERLRQGRATRPLLRDMDDDALLDYARRMQAEREAHYSRAAHTFDSSRLDTPDQVAASVEAFINQFITSTNGKQQPNTH